MVKCQFRSPTIIFLLDALRNLQCPLPEPLLGNFVHCLECPKDLPLLGGFRCNTAPVPPIPHSASDTLGALTQTQPQPPPSSSCLSSAPEPSPSPSIVLCASHVPSYRSVEVTLAHELIHALDHCRVASVDWSSPTQHACSEVRASSLSGECGYLEELGRGHGFTNVGGQHKACVRRRAVLSVAQNPGVEGWSKERIGTDVVDKVLDRCYLDTFPFMRHPLS